MIAIPGSGIMVYWSSSLDPQELCPNAYLPNLQKEYCDLLNCERKWQTKAHDFSKNGGYILFRDVVAAESQGI